MGIAVKAYNTYQEISSSAASSTERNRQLEDNIRAARNVRPSLPAPFDSQGSTGPASELRARFASKADELLALLEYVRGLGEDISHTRAALRAIRKKKLIEQLHASLKEDQDTLNHIIHQELP